MMDNGDGRVVNPVNNQNIVQPSVPTTVPQSQNQVELGQHQVPDQQSEVQLPTYRVSNDELRSLQQAFTEVTKLQAQHSQERTNYIVKENTLLASINKAAQTRDMLMEMYAKNLQVPDGYGFNLETGEFVPAQTQSQHHNR